MASPCPGLSFRRLLPPALMVAPGTRAVARRLRVHQPLIVEQSLHLDPEATAAWPHHSNWVLGDPRLRVMGS